MDISDFLLDTIDHYYVNMQIVDIHKKKKQKKELPNLE